MKKYKKIIPILILAILCSCSPQNQKNVETNPTPPEWSYNSTIYEANIRQYTQEGTFAAFEEHLPKLKEMGIEIIWLMPIHPIGEKNRKGTFGSYYSVKDYKGINPSFGTEKDFKRLVDKIHELNMYIIIDWVANHTAWDHPWTKTNKDFYTLDTPGNFIPPVPDWSDVIDLNYKNREMQIQMIDALKYWVEEFDIDGYRCDVAAMVPREFWSEVRKELDKIKLVFMLAEADEVELHKKGFDMTYGWPLKDLMNNFAKGETKIEDFKDYFLIHEKEYPANAFRMNFTTNHDENSWNGTVFERLGNLAEPFTVLISTAKGMPLVYSGQEAGMNKALEFFEKDEIEWKDHEKREIFTKIFNEKETNKALWNGEKGGEMNFINVSDNENVLAFYREKENDKIVVILNLSNKDSQISFSSEKIFGGYNNLFTEQKVILDAKNKFKLGAFDYLVFVN